MMSEHFAFLLPMVLTLFGVTFLIVARLGNRSALYWGLGYLFAALGFLIPLLTEVIPITAVAMFAEIAFLSAFLLYGQALVTHYATARYMRLRAGIALGAYAALTYVIVVAGSLRWELLISDLACSALLLVAVLSSWRRSRSWTDRALFGAASFVMLETMIRTTIFFIIAGTPNLDEFIGSPYAYVMQITSTIGALLLALTALAAVTVRILEHHRRAAEEDPLTGLLNRRGFEAHVTHHRKVNGDAAIIVADIDWFKSVNDRFGHAAGDEAIREVATLLRMLTWPGLVVARFGGEEFIAYLPNCRLQDAHTLAETVRLALSEQDLTPIGIDTPITASFGVAVTAAGDHTIYDAISRADRLLYLAKSSGRNRVMSSAVEATGAAGPRLFVV